MNFKSGSCLTGTFDQNHPKIKSILGSSSYNREYLFIQSTTKHTYILTICLKDTVSNTIRFSESFISGEKWSKSYITYTKPIQEVWEITLSANSGKYMTNCDYGYFTSTGKGSTYDRRIKPDVVAPGATVISSFNSLVASYIVRPTDKVLEMAEPSSKINFLCQG